MSILKNFLDFAGLSAYDNKIKQIINSKVAKIKMNNNTLTPDSSGEINLGNIATTSVASDSADGLMSKEDYTRLKNVAAGAEVNVQSDWNQDTTTADDYIKNKPTLGTASAKDVPSTGNASATQVVMGNDTRLSDSRNAKDVSAWAKASTKPTYTASEVGLGNVGNFLAVSTEAGQELSPTQQSNARANIGAGTSNFSGSYNDLSNKPTIPTVDSTLLTTSTNAIQNKAVTTELNKKANSSSLATVATSGSYNDLSNKPTIPTVNNGTLTIQKNGTEVQTFTANQGTNAIANITVPTKTSDLTNDSGFEQNVQSDWNVTDSTSDAYIKNKPSIPAAQVNSDWSASSGVAQILNKPSLGTAAAKNYTTSVTSGSNDLVTSGAVYTAIDNLPEPMIFKGSLGTGGTITTLPTASSSNEGFTYKVITAGTYAGQAAKVGDLFISNGSSWVYIPSADEPSGTVTSIATGTGLTGGTITSSGTISHADTSSQSSVSNSGRTYIQSVTLDGMGHVTGLTSATETVIIPSNNVTGSGTNGYIAKWNGANTVTNGPAFGSSTTTYLRNDGNWGTPPDNDTKNTAGSTDTSSKIFLIGATSQAANPQTYSDNEIYATNGVLTTKSVQVGGTAATMQYNSTNKCIDFIFA